MTLLGAAAAAKIYACTLQNSTPVTRGLLALMSKGRGGAAGVETTIWFVEPG